MVYMIRVAVLLAVLFVTNVQMRKRSVKIEDCTEIIIESGEYYYTSDGTQKETCAVLIIGNPNEVALIDVIAVKANCHLDSTVMVVDGWHMYDSLFPSAFDHPLPASERITPFCTGNVADAMSSPAQIMSSQNNAMIKYRLTRKGERFRIRVRFVENPYPCNSLIMDYEGSVTISNYGMRRNCTIAVMTPAKLNVTSIRVGPQRDLFFKAGNPLFKDCKEEGAADYVEVRQGPQTEIETTELQTISNYCGRTSNTDSLRFVLPCESNAIRLVSSGAFTNQVTFTFDALNPEEASSECEA